MWSTFVLLSDRIIDLLNLIIEKKLPGKQFLRSLVSCLICWHFPFQWLCCRYNSAFGRMSVDREIVAIKSNG